MEKTPGLVAVTKFVRPGSAVYASYINYMDRDEAVHGGEIHPDYSAYSENYMGNPEKTTGLFSMDYDRLSEDTAQIYKQQFRQAQENGSLLCRPFSALIINGWKNWKFMTRHRRHWMRAVYGE